jgi:hypothetical protein
VAKDDITHLDLVSPIRRRIAEYLGVPEADILKPRPVHLLRLTLGDYWVLNVLFLRLIAASNIQLALLRMHGDGEPIRAKRLY